jgi:ubiquitin-like protein 4
MYRIMGFQHSFEVGLFRLTFHPHLSGRKKTRHHPVSVVELSCKTFTNATIAIASIQITFKSTKPPKSYTLSVQPTDPISSIKSQLAATESGAPPSDAQRLLLRGKVLADNKLLKEYQVRDGDTVNLMVKPGFDWDPSKPSNTTTTTTTTMSDSALSTSPAPSPVDSPSKPHVQLSIPRRHGRTPSIVLSPSPSAGGSPISDNEKPLLDINLTLDTSSIPTASLATAARSSYHVTIANPDYWEKLYAFLKYVFHLFVCVHKYTFTDLGPCMTEANSRLRPMQWLLSRTTSVRVKAI